MLNIEIYVEKREEDSKLLAEVEFPVIPRVGETIRFQPSGWWRVENKPDDPEVSYYNVKEVYYSIESHTCKDDGEDGMGTYGIEVFGGVDILVEKCE